MAVQFGVISTNSTFARTSTTQRDAPLRDEVSEYSYSVNYICQPLADYAFSSRNSGNLAPALGKIDFQIKLNRPRSHTLAILRKFLFSRRLRGNKKNQQTN